MEFTSRCNTALNESLLLCQKYLEKVNKQQSHIPDIYSRFKISKEIYSINSRYLPRGFYCPSPDIEYIITNMKRGKIAKRPDRATRLSNRYLFDSENKLRICETFYPNESIKTEYIFHDKNVIYGVVFDEYDHMAEMSIEEYMNDRITSYLWATSLKDREKFNFHPGWMFYEIYDYKEEGYLNAEFFDISTMNKFVKYQKNRYRLNPDGNIISDSGSNLIATSLRL